MVNIFKYAYYRITVAHSNDVSIKQTFSVPIGSNECDFAGN